MKRVTTLESQSWLEQIAVLIENPKVFLGSSDPYFIDSSLPTNSRHMAMLADESTRNTLEREELLLFVTGWNIWTNEEFPNLFNVLMRGFSDTRGLIDAPGFLLDQAEKELASELFRFAMVSGWDASLTHKNAQISFVTSHDEWFSICAGSKDKIDQWCANCTMMKSQLECVLWEGRLSDSENMSND